jgi:dipeptidyl aminopeptidase/acylaminoacyl peptidase
MKVSVFARRASQVLLSLGLVGGGLGHAAPSAQDYARPPDILQARLAPSGQRLALILATPDGRNRLAVLDLPRTEPPRIVAEYANGNVEDFGWVNDKRVVYEVVDREGGAVVRPGHAGTFAVDHDGNDRRQLIAWQVSNDQTGTRIASRMLTYKWSWAGSIDDGGDDVWVRERQVDSSKDWTNNILARLNTVTGELRRMPGKVPEHTLSWLSRSGSEAAVVTTVSQGRARLLWRPDPGQDWTLLQDESYVDGAPMEPQFLVGKDELMVTALQGGYQALYSFDLAARRLSKEPIAAIKGFDLDPELEVDRQAGRVVGFHYRTDRPGTYWLDDKLHAIQRSVDAALPKGRSNRISCGRCESSRFLLVRSTSDVQPGEYYVYDRQERKLESIGRTRPWLDEAAQGRRTYHRVATRDGLDMPVYVTHPAGSSAKEALPAVVLVHGGPFVRGADVTWDQEAQFLASRGYRVIEPEYRGSTGYGAKLANAGVKQYGTGMLDDVLDAVQWAVRQGLIDEQRVCIMGGSYGGYAALMSPIRHPGAYRCAISFAGVTDLELNYTAWGSDLSEEHRVYWFPVMMGDPKLDAEAMRTASPLRRMRELKVPVLLAHGAQDRRVPVEHAHKFVDAAKEGGVDVSSKIYELAAHGWVFPADQADYFQRVETFLARHLGAPARQAASAQ